MEAELQDRSRLAVCPSVTRGASAGRCSRGVYWEGIQGGPQRVSEEGQDLDEKLCREEMKAKGGRVWLGEEDTINDLACTKHQYAVSFRYTCTSTMTYRKPHQVILDR